MRLRVSVLIPSYNHREYIEATLRSIWEQNYPGTEIVVIDDGSTDGTRELLPELQRRSPVPMQLHFHERNVGPATTVNECLQRSTGDLVIPFASDDLFAPDRLGPTTALFEESSALQILYANGRRWSGDKPGTRLHDAAVVDLLAQEPSAIARYLLTHTSPLFLQTATMRRGLIDKVGGYQSDVLVDDWLLNARIFQTLTDRAQFRYLDRDVAYYRVHDANVHRDFARQERLKLQFIERFTPPALQREARSHIHFNMAHQAFHFERYGDAWRHCRASLAAEFKADRLRFAFKIARRALKQKIAGSKPR